MENMYLLKKSQADRHTLKKVGSTYATVLSIACRVGMVLGLIAFIGIWASAESEALMIGRRLLWTAADVIFTVAMAAGWTISEGCRDE